MKALRPHWQRLNARYVALSRRERGLVAAALVFGPLLIGNALMIDPQLAKAGSLQRSIASQSASLAEMQAQLATLQQKMQTDPDAANKAALATLQAEQKKLDDDLLHYASTLVRPEQMNGLLERLLARHAGLRLISLKTLAPSSVLADQGKVPAKGASAPAVDKQYDLYRHGVEIRLEGNYADLQAYLGQLEQLQKGLLWGQLRYKVREYPRAEMSLMVYTLSPERAWLAL